MENAQQATPHNAGRGAIDDLTDHAVTELAAALALPRTHNIGDLRQAIADRFHLFGLTIGNVDHPAGTAARTDAKRIDSANVADLDLDETMRMATALNIRETGNIAQLHAGIGARLEKFGLQATLARPPDPAAVGAPVTPARANEVTGSTMDALELDELMRLSLALGIRPSGNIHQLRGDIGQKLIEFNEVLATAMGYVAHDFAPTRPLRRVHPSDLSDEACRQFLNLDEGEARKLQSVLTKAHAAIIVDMSPGLPRRISLFFHGTSGAKDGLQHLQTMVGEHGGIYKAVRDVAGVLANLINKNPAATKVDMVAGVSLGGGCAQYFNAALKSQVGDAHDAPGLIVLDPQLLNKKQARKAAAAGPMHYQRPAVEGLAITLDKPDKPRKNLMDRMQAVGFTHPGLVRLKLDVADGDAVTFDQQGRMHKHQDVSPTFMLGYHWQNNTYESAIHRFIQRAAPAERGQT